MGEGAAEMSQYVDPAQISAGLRQDIIDCWIAVSNAGGAAGFPFPPVAHWGTISHLHTLPALRGQGLGSTMMRSARRIARQEMGLEQLHLAARGGMGLERFYAKLGWREIGRWPGALRLAPDDDRDEILMLLTPL